MIEVERKRSGAHAKGIRLALFVKRTGYALTRDEILKHVWGYNILVTARSVDRCVNTLRNKIERNPQAPVFIKTICHVGYRFESLSPRVTFLSPMIRVALLKPEIRPRDETQRMAYSINWTQVTIKVPPLAFSCKEDPPFTQIPKLGSIVIMTNLKDSKTQRCSRSHEFIRHS